MRATASTIVPPHDLAHIPRIAPDHQPPGESTPAQDVANTGARQVAGVPPLPTTIPDPTTGMEALKLIHGSSAFSARALISIARWFARRDQNPILRPYLLTADVPTVLDRAVGQPARSLTVLVPGLSGVATAQFCIGIGGRSATVAGGGVVIPTLYVTLPLQADDIQLGFDPAYGQPNTSIPVFVLRWPTVQPFAAH